MYKHNTHPSPSSLTSHSSPYIPHPSPSPLTLLTHLSLLTLYPSLLTLYPSSLTPHLSLLTLYPSSLTPHPSLFIPHTPHPSPLTPHSSPSPLPHLTSLPTFSTVRKCLARGRKEEWGMYLPPPPSWSLGVVHQTGSHEVDLSDLAACVQVEEAEVVRERSRGMEREVRGERERSRGMKERG